MRKVVMGLVAVGALAIFSNANAAVEGGVSVDVDARASTTVNLPADKEINVSFFYEQLEPHGKWHKHATYGWVFTPKIVTEVKVWKPYASNGHWVWTDLGWYWQSDLPWGYIAFHYGRWSWDRELNWYWVPDTTWSPAWVTWRSSDAHYGWAPLPPGAVLEGGVIVYNGRRVEAGFDFGLADTYYTFVPANQFLAPNVIEVAVSSERVYRETRIVENSYKIENNTIINVGIPVQQVQQVTGREVTQVKVADAKAEGGKVTPDQVSGNQIMAFRPEVKKEATREPNAAGTTTDPNKKAEATQPAKTDAAKTADQQKTDTAKATDQKTDAKTGTDPKADANVKTNTDAKANADSKTATDTKAAADAKAKADTDAKAKADANKTSVDAKAKAGADAKAKADPAKKDDFKQGTETKFEPNADDAQKTDAVKPEPKSNTNDMKKPEPAAQPGAQKQTPSEPAKRADQPAARPNTGAADQNKNNAQDNKAIEQNKSMDRSDRPNRDTGNAGANRGAAEMDRGNTGANRGNADVNRGTDANRGNADANRGNSGANRGNADANRGSADENRGAAQPKSEPNKAPASQPNPDNSSTKSSGAQGAGSGSNPKKEQEPVDRPK
jgi:hypothetical protein